MSYCVNCGVELAPSERKCPLCGVEAVNPAKPWTEPPETVRPYPNRVETIVKRVNRRYGAVFASVLLLIPVFISLICDILISLKITWSIYVLGAAVCIFVIILLPLMYKKSRPVQSVLLDTLAVLAFLAIIDLLSLNQGWFLPMALPLTVALGVLMAECTYLITRRPLKALYTAALISFSAGLYCVCAEIIIDLYLSGAISLFWSWIVFSSCAVIGVVLMLMQKRARLLEEIKRRLFI